MVGDRLKRHRTDFEWTVERLARAAGISKAYLSMIEGGKRKVHWSLIMRLLHALDTTLCAFLTEHETVESAEDGVRSRRPNRLVLSGVPPDERGMIPLPPPSSYTHILTPWHSELATEVLEVYLEPHTEWTPEPVAFPGRVVCVGTQGRLLLVTRGTEYVMLEGETMEYDGSHAHSLRNYTDNPARVIMTVTPVAI